VRPDPLRGPLPVPGAGAGWPQPERRGDGRWPGQANGPRRSPPTPCAAPCRCRTPCRCRCAAPCRSRGTSGAQSPPPLLAWRASLALPEAAREPGRTRSCWPAWSTPAPRRPGRAGPAHRPRLAARGPRRRQISAALGLVARVAV